MIFFLLLFLSFYISFECNKCFLKTPQKLKYIDFDYAGFFGFVVYVVSVIALVYLIWSF